MTPHSLNLSQLQAVESEAQSLLIVAGPGTGKTHTLTQRIVSHLAHLEQGRKILAITFTRKAAEEMFDRLSARGPDVRDRIFVGTFHQFCVTILQQYCDLDCEIASPEECLRIARLIWADISVSECKKRLEEISRWKAVNFRYAAPGIVREFNKALRVKHLYDFDDLLMETFFQLQKDAQILVRIRRDFPEVCVDEYQDINAIQHDLLKLLIGKTQRITAIGDPNQAIYGFRGSDVAFFHSFEQDFPKAQVLYLQENYRNAKDLLLASSQVIAPDVDDAVPEQVARMYMEGHLTVHQAKTDRAEAEFVVHTIEQLVGGTSMFSQDSGRVDREVEGEISFGDIAVLYRLKSQSRELEKAFARSGMPFHVVGTQAASEDITDDLFAQYYEEPESEAEKVSLMTLHASKGLEFSCVFICGCEEGLMPLHLFKMTSDEKEERRLLYVGMTRAKHRLFLTHARKRVLYGNTLNNEPSRFLTHIEESLKNYSQSRHRPRPEKPDDGQMQLF